MSTITREFTKEQLQQIIETDHVQCGEASALARIALASLEAEPVAWAHRLINKRNGVVHPWVYGSAEACPSEGDIFNIEVMPLYTAPPAPIVPDEAISRAVDEVMATYAGSADECRNLVRKHIEDACRAAMLQGAEPVTTAYKLPDDFDFDRFNDVVWLETVASNPHMHSPTTSTIAMVALELNRKLAAGNSPVIPDGWVMVPVEPTEDMIVNGFESEPDESFSDEKEWEAYEAMSGCQQAAHRAKLCWAAMIAAAPQQEVK
ncbi:DUF551 domain-containing protein [Enterobacter ludwigii]